MYLFLFRIDFKLSQKFDIGLKLNLFFINTVFDLCNIIFRIFIPNY